MLEPVALPMSEEGSAILEYIDWSKFPTDIDNYSFDDNNLIHYGIPDSYLGDK
jgi:hypothetical protein